jgi:hypothetical protein
MSIVLQSSGGGSVTLEEPVTASNLTITVPAVTGTMAIQGPAFSAYATSNQTFSSGTTTKVLFDTEEFDTNANFASSRFTPTVAGYYQINSAVRPNVANGASGIYLYKNGSQFKSGTEVNVNSGTVNTMFISCLVYLNGTTDYVEIYEYVSATSTSNGSSTYTWFNGSLSRAA